MKTLLKSCWIILLAFYSCGKKCENVNMPYTVQEAYTENVSRQIKLQHQQSNLNYRRIPGALLLGELPRLEVKCTLSNSSKYGGNFTLYATLQSQGQELTLRESFYIPAHGTRECVISEEINDFSFQAGLGVNDWGIEAPEITVQEEVTRYRDVVKYRLCNTCDPSCVNDVVSR